jgi:uncharacterized phage infection (PIP) family protein YhgE
MNESTDTSTTARSGSRAANLKQRIKQDGKEKIETGKRAAADQIAEIADAIDLAGSQLDQSQPTLANYATQLANGVGTFATRLREDSIEDIYQDMRQLATRHPGMFLLGSAAIGLVAARFMKASAEEASVGDEDLGMQAETDADQQWGEASENIGDDDAESLARPRETPDPYGSPAYGA